MNIKNIIYSINDKRTQFIISLLLILLSLSISAKADTVIIYDNITVSQYKFITLESFGDIPLIDDYEYPVLFNNSFVGNYKKTDKIFYPDNVTITIIIPSLIKTSTDNLWRDNIKPQAFNVIGFISTWGILLLLICYAIYKIQRKIRKGY